MFKVTEISVPSRGIALTRVPLHCKLHKRAAGNASDEQACSLFTKLRVCLSQANGRPSFVWGKGHH